MNQSPRLCWNKASLPRSGGGSANLTGKNPLPSTLGSEPHASSRKAAAETQKRSVSLRGREKGAGDRDGRHEKCGRCGGVLGESPLPSFSTTPFQKLVSFVTKSGIWSCFSVVPVLRKVVAFLLLLFSIKSSSSSWRVCHDCVFLSHLTEGKQT